jgi:EAL domain-containing protein (putative c-di-GMP-specific phosphodiesterase class I)/GGDEF domain-containing protein
MSVARAERRPERKVDPSIRFIQQYLRERSSRRLTGLLLGQLDAYNRISTTFGQEVSADFCRDSIEDVRRRMAPGTPVVRLSGRRFAVIVSLDAITSIVDTAAKLAEHMQPQIQVGEDTFLVDLTFGVAVYPTHADDAASLFRRAELALKEAAANELPFDLYRPDATQQQAALWKLESDLDKAVQAGELEVYYQPKIEIGSRNVCGAEALVRWRMRSGRSVSPEQFIPIAEHSGCIVPLTWLVFDCVEKAARRWGRFGEPFSIAVNIPPQVLTHERFCARVRALRDSLAACGAGLSVELTEDSLLQSDNKALANLEWLRTIGVELAIDDFGKGYSSLTYLKQIPATEIKIDRRFVSNVSLDKKDRQIVKAVIELARALDMRVVAEGVDSEPNLAVLGQLGCGMAQGFLIARPMRADLLPDWVERYSAGSTLSRAVTA